MHGDFSGLKIIKENAKFSAQWMKTSLDMSVKIQITKGKEKTLYFFLRKQKCDLQKMISLGSHFPSTMLSVGRQWRKDFEVLINNILRVIRYFLHPWKGGYLKLDYIQKRKKMKTEKILASLK